MRNKPKPISPQQQRILDFIGAYTHQHGFPPTLREIMLALCISSTSVAAYHLDALERKNYIERTPKAARGIRIKVAA